MVVNAGVQENQENVIIETYPKVDYVEENWVYGAFLLCT